MPSWVSHWRDDTSGLCPSAEAKRAYFLTPADLALLHHERVGGGIGCGAPERWYYPAELRAAALAKHGEAGLAKKAASRTKREANKRAREEEAASAEAALARGDPLPPSTAAKRAKTAAPAESSSSASASASASPTAAEAAADRLAVEALRKEARGALARACTWDLLRAKQSPNGTSTSVRLERVEARHYAALIGLRGDPTLRSLVKKGAWYSVYVSCDDLFEEGVCGKGGKYGSNGQLGVRSEDEISVKYSPASKTMSIGAYISRIDY